MGGPRIWQGRLPLAITVFGATIEEQIAFVRMAAERGADWVILQPPCLHRKRPITENLLVDFFGTVADAAPVPVAIQNAPQYIGVGLSSAGLDRLSRDHPNVRLLKAEGSALDTRALIELTEGRMAVFQARGGMEFSGRDPRRLRRHDPVGSNPLPRPVPDLRADADRSRRR